MVVIGIGGEGNGRKYEGAVLDQQSDCRTGTEGELGTEKAVEIKHERGGAEGR